MILSMAIMVLQPVEASRARIRKVEVEEVATEDGGTTRRPGSPGSSASGRRGCCCVESVHLKKKLIEKQRDKNSHNSFSLVPKPKKKSI